jgi:PadR family transcriptional regulator PadR
MKTRNSEPVFLGSLEEQVMLAVLRRAGDAYGMNVRRELEKVTGRDVTIGSVYVTLDRLEAKGLVASERTARGDAGTRRVFTVTAEGASALADTRSARERLWNGVRLPHVLRDA